VFGTVSVIEKIDYVHWVGTEIVTEGSTHNITRCFYFEHLLYYLCIKNVTTAPTHSESYAGRLDFVKDFA
jgi:hypothetical protein